MSADEPLWTSRDVADYLRVSLSWVEHGAADGTIPSVKLGRMRRFHPEAIRALAVPPTTPGETRRSRRRRT